MTSICYYCNQSKGFQMIGVAGIMKCSNCGKNVDIEKCVSEEKKLNEV